MNREDGSFSRQRPRQPWLRYLALTPFAAGAVLLSVFFFTAVVALFLVATLGFGVRIWWLRRKMRSAAVATSRRPDQPLEGEFTVVRENDGQNEAKPVQRARR
ncbi:MAG: hypothetical protein ACYDHM_10225 [Acidiferrobacterales bacterium]